MFDNGCAIHTKTASSLFGGTQANPLGGAMSTPKPAAPGAVVAGAGVSSAQGPAQGQQLPLPTDLNALYSEIMGIVSKYNPKLGSKEKIMSHINKHTQNAGGNRVLGMQNLLKQLRGKYLTGTATAAFTSAAAGVPSTPNPPLTHTGKIADDGLSVFCMKQPLLSHPFSLAHLSPPLRLLLIDPFGINSLFFGVLALCRFNIYRVISNVQWLTIHKWRGDLSILRC